MRAPTWKDVFHTLATIIILVEIRQVIIGQPVDQGLVALAGALSVSAEFFRRGNGKPPAS